MEFDSDEERQIFGKTGEDDEDIESEYSSTEEDFLDRGVATGELKRSSLHLSSSEEDESLASKQESIRTEEKEGNEKVSILPIVMEAISDDEVLNDDEVMNDDEVKDVVKPVCSPRSFRNNSASTSSKSTTPPIPPEGDEGEFFVEDMDFTDEIINHASSFITTPTLPQNISLQTTSTNTVSGEASLTVSSDKELSKLSSHPPNDEESKEELIPATNDIGIPDTLFNPVSPNGSPQSSPRSIDINILDVDQDLDSPVSTPHSFVPLYERERTTSKSPKALGKKHRRRCSMCEACLNEIDCRKCRFCKDMKKYGGVGRLRQKCIKRQCLKFSRLLYTEDPLVSGGNIRLQEEIKQEFEKLESLPKQYDGVHSTGQVTDHMIETKAMVSESSKYSIHSLNIPTVVQDTAAILAQSLVEQKSQSTVSSKPLKKPPSKKTSTKRSATQQGRKKVTKRPKVSQFYNNSDSDSERVTYTTSTRRRRHALNDLYDGWIPHQVPAQQQCEGPECIYAARPNSKYCCEECGIKLAIKRIETYLPEQKKLWESSEEPVATKFNKQKLTELEEEQKIIKNQLSELDRQTQNINDHVTKMKDIKHEKNDEGTDHGESDDLTIYCASCSQPIGIKKALLHMERCFSKLEGMVSFGSIVKNEGTDIFCDKYDRSQGTYCKRLRVLCPEHTKEPKVGPHEVCGCPFEPDFPSKKTESLKFCYHLKKSCVQHYCWEKLRRAEIDQEKLNLYLKLEEVNEQSRLVQWQLNYRSSLLSIMLHHTIDHSQNTSLDINECINIS